MDHQTLAKIKERIAQLLAMAADASSPNEAAIAAQRARKLMDKHQLDEFDIAESKEKEFAAVFAGDHAARVAEHASLLAVAVGRYNDCHVRWHYAEGTGKKRRQKAIMFMGFKNDAEMAEQMFNRLMFAIDKMCKKYMKETHGGFTGGVAPEYKRAATSALIQRFKQMTAARQELILSNGTALVVAKIKGVEDYFGKTKYTTSRVYETDDYNAARARQAGYRDGHKIEITSSVE